MHRITAAISALLLTSSAATAAESTSLAVKAGFLLGHAQRCGIAAERIDGVANVVQKLIADSAADSQEQQTAGHRFVLIFLATSSADAGGDRSLIPPCKPIVAAFEQLERHHQRTASSGQTASSGE